MERSRRLGAEGEGRMGLLVSALGRSVDEPEAEDLESRRRRRRAGVDWPSKPTDELPTRCFLFLRLGEVRRGDARDASAEGGDRGVCWKALRSPPRGDDRVGEVVGVVESGSSGVRGSAVEVS